MDHPFLFSAYVWTQSSGFSRLCMHLVFKKISYVFMSKTFWITAYFLIQIKIRRMKLLIIIKWISLFTNRTFWKYLYSSIKFKSSVYVNLSISSKQLCGCLNKLRQDSIQVLEDHLIQVVCSRYLLLKIWPSSASALHLPPRNTKYHHRIWSLCNLCWETTT